MFVTSLDVEGENLAWLAAFSLNQHAHTDQQLSLPSPPPPLSLSFSLSHSLPLPLWVRERVISRNLSEAVPETPERRYPRKAQHGYNCNLHQVYRRISAVRRARKVSDRTAAFVWPATHTHTHSLHSLHCVSSCCLCLVQCWQQPSHTAVSVFACEKPVPPGNGKPDWVDLNMSVWFIKPRRSQSSVLCLSLDAFPNIVFARHRVLAEPACCRDAIGNTL